MNPAAPVTAYRIRGAYRPLLPEPVDLRIADEEHVCLIGDDRRVLAVGTRPEQMTRQGVARVGPSLQRREVDAPREHGRRTGDLSVRLELPLEVAGCRV